MNDTTLEQTRPSGRFVVRVSPDLHAALRDEASVSGISLNRLCIRRLQASGGADDGPVIPALSYALPAFGGSLQGIVAHGPWARGEGMGRDELDLLFVLGPDVPIARELYREWDAASPVWEGSRLCPEFVHLPTPGRPPSGLWAEMATEGIVLFERDLVVSRCLMGIRNRIAFGEFTRGQVRGRPYWIAREDDA